ncbi:MAG: hypothetical protein HYU99_02630 [Deltaproteobacteria bacterium]|nr:hypothetical protein [Deltaproteobacteria bacterium]
MKLFFILCVVLSSLASLCFAQDLTIEAVAEIWPYAETILKVKASRTDIVREDKKLRKAKVIAQSADRVCTAYEALFEMSPAGGWSFDSTVKEYEVSCHSHRAKGGPKNPAILEKTIPE